MPHLNSISTNHSAIGETLNKKGKTDILSQNNYGENVFIGECKIWHGESEVLKAIDQLLERYVTWRDEYTSLIIFNKDNKDFSKLIETIKEAMTKHPNFDSFVKENSKTSISYIFKNIDDPTKKEKFTKNLKLRTIIYKLDKIKKIYDLLYKRICRISKRALKPIIWDLEVARRRRNRTYRGLHTQTANQG